MIWFWRIKNGISRIRIVIIRFSHLVLEDLDETFSKYIARVIRKVNSLFNHIKPEDNYLTTPIDRDLPNASKPVIFVSACVDAETPGGWKYNGGINEYNSLVKILRKHGYEAYIVTYDGNYEPWLFEHQPHISIKEFRRKITSLPNIRCVTSWAIAKTFINECKKLYFWDMELKYTENEHFSTIARLYKTKIVKTASISRTIQAWHMANFGKQCIIIPNLLDEDYWKPDNTKRKFNRIGYMNEGEYVEPFVALIKDAVKMAGLELEFYLIKGETLEVLNGMQSSNLFISMNQGKDPFWGEGCPRTIIEALSTGAVVLAYDIIGNREILIDSFNGIIVPRYRSDIMAKKTIELYQKPSEIEELRQNGLNLIQSCHTLEKRWPAIKNFLDIEEAGIFSTIFKFKDR